MSKVQIRKFKIEDQKILAPLYLESRKETFHWMPEEGFQLLDFDKDTTGEEIFVAVVDQTPVGFISIWMDDNFIHHLYIDKNYKRMGVGKKLLDYGLSVTGRPASLKCVVRNENAVGFYKSQGWLIEETGNDEMGPYHLFILE